jgi:hypothetical protein
MFGIEGRGTHRPLNPNPNPNTLEVTMKTVLRPLLLLAATAVLAAPPILAQEPDPDARRAPGAMGMMRGGMDMMTDPLETALEQAETLGLSVEQVTRLEGFHQVSQERTAQAREVVTRHHEEMRTRMEERREEGTEPRMRRGPRSGGEAMRSQMDPELREAMSLLRQERQNAQEELRAALTGEQFRALQQHLRGDRPGTAGRRAPGAAMTRPDRMRAPGVGQRMMIRQHRMMALSHRALARGHARMMLRQRSMR